MKGITAQSDLKSSWSPWVSPESHISLLSTYCVPSPPKGKPKAKGQPWSLLCFVPSKWQIVFLSFQFKSANLISISWAWLPRKCASRKKIRARSRSLGLYHDHESAVLNCTAREEAGPPAGRVHRETIHCLGEPCWPGAPAPLLTTCPRGWGDPRLRGSWFLHTCISLTPLPNIGQL